MTEFKKSSSQVGDGEKFLGVTGNAELSSLPEPIDTRYGFFTHARAYPGGCDPVAEISGGIGVIYFKARNSKGDELTFSIGRQFDAAPDIYCFTGYVEEGDDSRRLVREYVTDAEITAPILPDADKSLSDALPNAVQTKTAVDWASYRVHEITGLTYQNV